MSHDQANSARNSWVEFALILLVFFIHGGAPAPQINETYYLTKAKHYWDPQWCAGDFFLESADAHLVFYWTIGWLAKFFSLPTVAWIGRFAAWAALAWSWQRLCRCVTHWPLIPVLGAALLVWLTSEYNFAGEWVVSGVEGKCFAYACVFAGLAALARGYWRNVWPWLGLASAFHPLVGGWSAIAAAGVWLLEPRDQRPSLARMSPALALALVLSLPGLIPALLLTSSVPPEVSSEANKTYVFDRLPHHLAPLSQEAEVLIAKTARFCLPLIVFLILWLQLKRSHEQRSGNHTELNRICRFAACSFLFSLAGMTWELACANYHELAASVLKYYWFRLADVAVPLAAVLLACYWIEKLLRERSRFAVTALAISLAAACWHLTSTTVTRLQDSTPPADKNLAAPAAWREACEWLRDNTPADALCLVPRSAQSLSWYAGRKSLVTWKDVPQDAAGIVAWGDRYEDVFSHDDEFGELVPYGSLGEEGAPRIRELAEKYKVDYVVAEEYPPLQLPIAYANSGYTVYAVSPSAQQSVKSSP